MRASLQPHLAAEVGRIILGARTVMAWSQDELSRRSGLTQSAISRLERGLHSGIDLDELERLVATLGGRFRLGFDAPYLADRARQRDRVHARCIAYVARRLERAGWLVQVEVEIRGSAGPGWIDVLAWHPIIQIMLVIEIKTEIHDLGRIQRTLDWYEHGAWAAARRLGWRPRRACGALLVLDSAAVERGLRDNRELALRAFPGRAAQLMEVIGSEGATARISRRFMAAIDPGSRRASWLRPTRLDGRRTPSAYLDYAEAARRLSR